MKKERKEAWMRIFVAIISGITLDVWGIVIGLVAIFNWFTAVFSAQRNPDWAEFCEPWNTEVYKYMRYLTAVSNKRPFPFSSVESMSQFEK